MLTLFSREYAARLAEACPMTALGVFKHNTWQMTNLLGAVREALASHSCRSTELNQAVTSLALLNAEGGLLAPNATSLEAAPMLVGNQLFPRKELTYKTAQAAGVERLCRPCHLNDTCIHSMLKFNAQVCVVVGNVASASAFKFTALPNMSFE